jgi:hypothetical protein
MSLSPHPSRTWCMPVGSFPHLQPSVSGHKPAVIQLHDSLGACIGRPRKIGVTGAMIQHRNIPDVRCSRGKRRAMIAESARNKVALNAPIGSGTPGR